MGGMADAAGTGILVGIIGAVIAIVFANFYFKSQVLAAQPSLSNTQNNDKKTERLVIIANEIHDGAIAFLTAEYKALSYFVLFMFIVLSVLLIGEGDRSSDGLYTAICFLLGALLSGYCGWAGMAIATEANVRTTYACSGTDKPLNKGLRVAFNAGSVMGLNVVGFGLLGVSVAYLLIQTILPADSSEALIWKLVSGFGFGASSIALFARVGGGVYTKAADVGADLVGKVENNIPEDDPGNPAVIADNVGDNVGDVAGMGADLFESYVGGIIAAATLAQTEDIFKTPEERSQAAALPFFISGLGIVASIIGNFFVKTDKESAEGDILSALLWSINKGIYLACAISAVLSLVSVFVLFGSHDYAFRIFIAVVIGMVAGQIVGSFTEYCTSYEDYPTQSISHASETGPATVIIRGLGVGMLSTTVPVFAIGGAILGSYACAKTYGIAIAGVGMLSTLGITLATDAYGPVADNAGGIAEMCPEEVSDSTRDLTDALDAMGNTTAATGKGFAIGSAVLTAMGLIAAFMNASNLDVVNLKEARVLTGVLFGAMLPFLFGALTMLSVGESAQKMIVEVRRQFKLYPILLEADPDTGMKTAEQFQRMREHNPPLPESKRCVRIATECALEEMLLPGLIAVFAPAVIGFLLGAPGLGGMLGGSLTSGFMLAVTMSNAGGAWDNAKKWIEKYGKDLKHPKTGDAWLGGKGSEFHDAVVVGDTVGDPFKDTSGPALNILIKLMSIVSLVIAPVIKEPATVEGTTEETIVAKTWWASAIIVIFGAMFAKIMLSRFAANEEKRQAELAEVQRAAGATSYSDSAAEGPKEDDSLMAENDAAAVEVESSQA